MMSRRLFCRKALAWAAVSALPGCMPENGCNKNDPVIRHLKENRPFPVVISHALGQTEIRGKPERVVVLGVETADLIFEMGVVPVAVEANFWGGDSSGLLIWYRDALEKSGQKLPELINMYPEPDVEKLVALQADLILAPQSGMSEALFRQLSALAPVIPYPKHAWRTTQAEIIEISAAALGRQEQARLLKWKIAHRQAAFLKKYPQFQDYTFAYIYSGGHRGHLSVYREGDPRVDALCRLGLQLAPFVQELPLKVGAFTSDLGLENADRLDETDILVTWFNSSQELDAVMKNPLYAQIPAIRRGSYIPLLDRPLATAMYSGTPLAADWALPKFLPLLLDAVVKADRHRFQTASGG